MHNYLENSAAKIKNSKIIPPVLVFIWPVIYLFPYFFIIKGNYLSIGSDFIECYYNYKAYLLAELINLRIPLWSPAEAAGFPFYSSPLTQTFYPLNILLAGFYRLAGDINLCPGIVPVVDDLSTQPPRHHSGFSDHSRQL
jgi:hypothetical protein